tara:strand:+ start:94 stop:540 length:447 start_codon:yes stop_codon:yes gene_type:complete
MKYNPKSDFDRKKAQLYFDKLMSGTTPFEVTSLKKRSSSQNAILHVFLSYLGLELGYTLDYVKLNIWKMKWLRTTFYVEDFNKKTGIAYHRVRSSKELTKEEMSHAIGVLIEKASSECGVIFPNEKSQSFDDDFLLMQNEIYKAEKYL